MKPTVGVEEAGWGRAHVAARGTGMLGASKHLLVPSISSMLRGTDVSTWREGRETKCPGTAPASMVLLFQTSIQPHSRAPRNAKRPFHTDFMLKADHLLRQKRQGSCTSTCPVLSCPILLKAYCSSTSSCIAIYMTTVFTWRGFFISLQSQPAIIILDF